MNKPFLRITFSLLLALLPLCMQAQSKNWAVEAEPGGKVVWLKDGTADVYAKGGLTLWNKQLMKGNVTIEYDARIVGDGRISDLNCFWMASDPQAKTVFSQMKKRGGKFVESYALQLYYLGYGGNSNTTTRFRRYTGDRRGVADQQHRPIILREYLDASHLLKADHWYHIKIQTIDGRTVYYIDGEKLIDFLDPTPLKEGYFGFRTTLSHAQLKNFTITNCSTTPLDIMPIGKVTDEPQPVTFGIPYAKGEGAKWNGTQPYDSWTLANWDDGSVKWQAVATVFNPNDDKLAVYHSDNGNLADSIVLNGKNLVGKVWVEKDGAKLPVLKATKEQEGKVRTCWRFDGKDFTARLYKYNGSNQLKVVFTSFVDSATATTGMRSYAIKAQVPLRDEVHKRHVAFLTDSSTVYTMDVKPLVARRFIMLDKQLNTQNPGVNAMIQELAAWDGFRLSQLSPNGFSIRKRATAQSPWIGTKEGHRAPGVLALGDTQGSVSFHLDDFWQSYPSTLQVDDARSDNATVSLYLWSPEAEAMDYCHYDTIAHGLNSSYEDVQEGLSTAQGIARTSIIYITPSSLPVVNSQKLFALEGDNIQNHLPKHAVHTQYVPTPEYLHSRKAFGYWSLPESTKNDAILKDLMAFYVKEQDRHSWYGYYNYGDFMHTYDQQRDEWRYDVGGYAWDNTELGTPAMLWYQFLRTGDPETWRMAVAMTRHCSEVDSYHRGFLAGLGSRHNVLHWGCGSKESRVSQAFWNRFMYYLTADERLGEIMHEVVDADQLLYTLDPMRLAQPRSDKYPCTAPARLRVGPDWVAYAGNWFTEWERTGNTKYRDKILAGMQSIAAMPHGLFSGPKALGYDPATGIITWEGDTAVQNTNHLLSIMGGFEIVNEMMMSVNTPEWSRAWLDHAMYYKEKCHNSFRIPRLQAYAYWLTGKKECYDSATNDLRNPLNLLAPSDNIRTTRFSPIFCTNDAALFTLDAVFMQEVLR